MNVCSGNIWENNLCILVLGSRPCWQWLHEMFYLCQHHVRPRCPVILIVVYDSEFSLCIMIYFSRTDSKHFWDQYKEILMGKEVTYTHWRLWTLCQSVWYLWKNLGHNCHIFSIYYQLSDCDFHGYSFTRIFINLMITVSILTFRSRQILTATAEFIQNCSNIINTQFCFYSFLQLCENWLSFYLTAEMTEKLFRRQAILVHEIHWRDHKWQNTVHLQNYWQIFPDSDWHINNPGSAQHMTAEG